MRNFRGPTPTSPARCWSVVALVAALHGLALWGLWQTQFRPQMAQAAILFVSLIERHEPPAEAPKRPARMMPKRPDRPEPLPQIVAAVPVSAPSDFVAPPMAMAAPEPAPPPAATPVPPQRVTLPELAVACPERSAPVYPPFARRLGEQGEVVVRVFLDERGRVTDAVVNKSSGSSRLDEAAMQAVRRWQCRPAMRDGQAVPAVALQPFNFVLERS